MTVWSVASQLATYLTECCVDKMLLITRHRHEKNSVLIINYSGLNLKIEYRQNPNERNGVKLVKRMEPSKFRLLHVDNREDPLSHTSEMKTKQ